MTTDQLLAQIDEYVEKKLPMSPGWWIEQAQKLVVLMSGETDLLYKLQKEVAIAKMEAIEHKVAASMAEAKNIVEATDLYEAMQKQRAKCHRIEEIIRLAKIQSRMRSEEYLGGSL